MIFERDVYLYISGHLRKKHLKALIQCCYCGEKRSSTSATMRHIDTVHFDIRKFPCPTCNHRFTCKRDYNNHINAAHSTKNGRNPENSSTLKQC